MRNILILYRERKNSILDMTINIIGKQKGFLVETMFYPIRNIEKIEPGSIILIRNSDIPTKSLENKFLVYPLEKVRYKTKNKLNIYNYCIQNKIPTPKTIKAETMLDQYVFKSIIGSNKSIVNPFENLNILAQEKIIGKVVKIYGNIDSEQFIGFYENSKEKVDVPQYITDIGKQILNDFNLIWAGLDWIVSDYWYLIDINATSGFGYSNIEDTLPIIQNGLEILLKKISK